MPAKDQKEKLRGVAIERGPCRGWIKLHRPKYLCMSYSCVMFFYYKELHIGILDLLTQAIEDLPLYYFSAIWHYMLDILLVLQKLNIIFAYEIM